MKVLITGICGFVGATLAKQIAVNNSVGSLIGIDNFSRAGSRRNVKPLADLGIEVIEGDIRCPEDLAKLPEVDWVIDAAANPCVLAGIDGVTTSRRLVDDNLVGSINLLEFCKQNSAGFTLISTSRVYSIEPLSNLVLQESDHKFVPDEQQDFCRGISPKGATEDFSTTPPVSLYGSTKVASEQMALEYGHTFDFPVWINRCGVLAGAGQFGHPAQGIFSFWIHSFRERSPLKYIGFGGNGYQVRDCLHPCDLVSVIEKQIDEPFATSKPRICNFGGGIDNCMSLANLTDWCNQRFEPMKVQATDEIRPFDIGWMVLDSARAEKTWDWRPRTSLESVLTEIADFANRNPEWLEISNPSTRSRSK